MSAGAIVRHAIHWFLSDHGAIGLSSSFVLNPTAKFVTYPPRNPLFVTATTPIQFAVATVEGTVLTLAAVVYV
jgi:hypothetical protein